MRIETSQFDSLPPLSEIEHFSSFDAVLWLQAFESLDSAQGDHSETNPGPALAIYEHEKQILVDLTRIAIGGTWIRRSPKPSNLDIDIFIAGNCSHAVSLDTAYWIVVDQALGDYYTQVSTRHLLREDVANVVSAEKVLERLHRSIKRYS